MTFPPHVGYPIGDGDQANRELFYMLQIHYDNPEMKNNTKFETGFTFHYTNKTRLVNCRQNLANFAKLLKYLQLQRNRRRSLSCWE